MLGCDTTLAPGGSLSNQRMAVRDKLRMWALNPEAVLNKNKKKTEADHEKDDLLKLLIGLSLESIVVTAPCRVLQNGLCFLDVPGPSDDALRCCVLEDAMKKADIVLFVLTEHMPTCDFATSVLDDTFLARVVSDKAALWMVWHWERMYTHVMHVMPDQLMQHIETKYDEQETRIRNTLGNVERLISCRLKRKISVANNANVQCCGHVWPSTTMQQLVLRQNVKQCCGLVSLIGRFADPNNTTKSWWDCGMALCSKD